MYDPLELSEKVEKIVCRGIKRKYYRFRATKFYGGISTADTVGCNLRCKFCWSGNIVWNPDRVGKFYTPKEVARKLSLIAKDNGFYMVRASGGEPTIGREHLLNLLGEIPRSLLFILETNGILLGAFKDYVKELAEFPNVHVRVCLKGCDEEEFTMLTGAREGFGYQLKALEFLRDENISFNIALVSLKRDRRNLFRRLETMGLGKIMIEEEYIKLYPPVKERLRKTNLLQRFVESDYCIDVEA